LDNVEAIVKVTQADKKVAYFKLKEGQTISVGRRDSCNLTIKDDFLSGEHCTLRVEDGHFIVKDMESKNGTYLNESALTENHVFVGDVVRIGDTTFELAGNKMNTQMVDHFTYKGEKRGTEFMSMSNFQNPMEGKEVKIELETNVKNNASHFAEMREKKRKRKRENKESDSKTIMGKLTTIFKKKD